MTVKYADNNYKHKLEKEVLDYLTDKTNRSKLQTLFLFNLVDGDMNKYKRLEEQLKNCLCFFCPDTDEQVEEVMNMTPVWNKLKFED